MTGTVFFSSTSLPQQLHLHSAFIRGSNKIANEIRTDIISDNADSFMKKYNMKIIPENRVTLLTYMFLAARNNSTKVLKKMLEIETFCINVDGALLGYYTNTSDPRLASRNAMSLIDDGQDVQGGSTLLTALLYHNWEAVQIVVDQFPKIFKDIKMQEFWERFFTVGKIQSLSITYRIPTHFAIIYQNGFTEIYFTTIRVVELDWTILKAEICRPKTSPKFVEFMINHGAQISEDILNLANMKSLIIQTFLEQKNLQVALEKLCADKTILDNLKKIMWLGICVDEEWLKNWNQSYEILQSSFKLREKLNCTKEEPKKGNHL